MKKKSLVFAVATSICATAWLASHGIAADKPASASANSGSAAASANAGPPTSLSSAIAQKQDVPLILNANASVSPVANLELRPQVSNTLSKVHIKEGDTVKQGQLLFSLDQRIELANIEKARAQLAKDKASMLDLERQLRRSQELVAQKFISQGAADTLQAQVQAQQAQLKLDQANLQSAQVALDYTQIKAPLSGRIGAINVYPGSLVQTSTVLAQITQLDPINIGFTLPESELSALMAAQKAGKVSVQASVPNSNQWLSGKLSFIDNAVDSQAGNIKLKAQFDNREMRLWPGQFVQAQLTIATLKDAVVIPLAAVITNARGKSVYTIEADQTAKQRPITLLHNFGAKAAVSGLQGGEKVIVDGKQNLRTGGKVKEINQEAESRQSGKKDKPV